LMRSSISRWQHSDLKPFEVLATGYRVIAIGQRNAGESRAPIRATDGWSDYAQDAISLIDHFGLESLALWGRCIGPSFPRTDWPQWHQSRSLHARLLPVG
jgi:pimeloyl-ACP methyl ester carboxylesterase